MKENNLNFLDSGLKLIELGSQEIIDNLKNIPELLGYYREKQINEILK